MEELVGKISHVGAQAFEREAELFSVISNSHAVMDVVNSHELQEGTLRIRPFSRADLGDSLLIQSLHTTTFSSDESGCHYAKSIPDFCALLGEILDSHSQLLFCVESLTDNLQLLTSLRMETKEGLIRGEIWAERAKHLKCVTSVVQWLEAYCRREFNTDLAEIEFRDTDDTSVGIDVLGFEFSTEVRQRDCLGSICVTHSVAVARKTSEPYCSTSQLLTAGPSIGFREKSFTADAVAHGWMDKHSSYLQQLSNDFGEFVGSKYCLPTSSCTGALHLALASLGVSHGDEVIVPAITWVASASAVAYTGATPIFADIEHTSWTLDVTKIESLITDRTKAIVVVHLYGYAADLRQLKEIADRHGIYLVEDAAPAIGATSGGSMAGTVGHVGCFSFQGAKLLVSGEGGMLVTNSPEIFAAANKFQEHGRRPGTFWIDQVGFKYKMSNLTAALAVAQLHRIGPQIEKKQRIYSWYESFLGHVPGIGFQKNLAGNVGISWMTSVVLTGHLSGKRSELVAHLGSRGIDTRPVFPNLAHFSFWSSEQTSLPIADSVSENGVNLPSGVLLNRIDIRRIAAAVEEFSNALK